MREPMLYRETPNVVIPRKFIADDKAYGEALEAFVAVCTDCLFINREKCVVYLAKRKAKPMSCEWWFIGGRVFAGEEEHTAMRRCIKRETGLDVDPNRLTFLTMKRYLFKDRQQEPQEKGCDSLCYIFGLEVTEAEIATIRSNLDGDEYDLEAGLQEFTPAKLTAENVFPSIIDVYGKAFPCIAVERPAREEEIEEWSIISEGGIGALKYDQVQVLGKDLPMVTLGEKIPQNKLEAFRRIAKNQGLEPENIKSWSRAAVLLNKVLHIHRHDGRFFGVFHFYYTVYPDATVSEGGFTQLDNKKVDVCPIKPRRPVHWWKDRYVAPRVSKDQSTSVSVTFKNVPFSSDEFFVLTGKLKKLHKGVRDAFMGEGVYAGGGYVSPYCGFSVPKDSLHKVLDTLGTMRCGSEKKPITHWLEKSR